MKLKELIKFGMEESQEPVIKNPILRQALEPRTMDLAGGGLAEEYYGKDRLDWMENYKDQMTFEEYLRFKNSGSFAEGGRSRFYEGKLVTQGKRKGQWAIYNVPASIDPGRVKYFPDETAMNKWIKSRPGKGDSTFGERSKKWKRETKGKILP